MNPPRYYAQGGRLWRIPEPGNTATAPVFLANCRYGMHPSHEAELANLLNAGAALLAVIPALRDMVDFHAGVDDTHLRDLAAARDILARFGGAQ